MPDNFFCARWACLKTFLRSYPTLLCVCGGGGGGGGGAGGRGKRYYVVFICFFISREKN